MALNIMILLAVFKDVAVNIYFRLTNTIHVSLTRCSSHIEVLLRKRLEAIVR
jgi:hypothetical protein